SFENSISSSPSPCKITPTACLISTKLHNFLGEMGARNSELLSEFIIVCNSRNTSRALGRSLGARFSIFCCQAKRNPRLALYRTFYGHNVSHFFVNLRKRTLVRNSSTINPKHQTSAANKSKIPSLPISGGKFVPTLSVESGLSFSRNFTLSPKSIYR